MDPHKNKRPTSRSLLGDNTGAIMIIGVFMAMLVTGFLYYIIGIGNTIIYRERMQDAADSIAFSGAVTYARGMNLVALINIIMALLMAIWIVMRIVQTALQVAIVACAISVIAFGGCSEAIPALEDAESVVDRVQDFYARTILEPALRLGHTAEGFIRDGWPWLAQGQVVANTLAGAYQPPVEAGMLLPPVPRPLPIKAVELRHTCMHAGQYIAALITLPLSFFGPIRSVIENFLGGVLGNLYCLQDDTAERPYEIDPGTAGDCTDGMPGQDCEYVQIRGAVLSSHTPFAGNERGVTVANWGRGVGGGLFGVFEPLTRVALAQAEYYYEGTEGRDEWTWHMYWRARFRRFRVAPFISSIPGLGGFDLSALDRVIVH